MTRFRKFFSRNSHSNDTFHPDRPPPEPYPAPDPYAASSSYPPGHATGFDTKQEPYNPSPGSDMKSPPDTYASPFPPLPQQHIYPHEQPTYQHQQPYTSDPPPPFETLEHDDNLPPPSFHALQLTSPTSNAPSDLANAAWDFTDMHPLAPPSHFTPDALDAISSGCIGLAPPPPRFTGLITSSVPGEIHVSTAPGCPDTCLVSALPLFAAGYHHPLNTGREKSVYFEVLVECMPRDTAVAIGFAAVPYPGFRLPGWNRGSLGVHGDDGRRYVNDAFGGRDFVAPFREGEMVGMGMKWGAGNSGVEVWFTRGGVREGEWRLDEQRDRAEENDPMPGLDGGSDVYAAVGVWGGGVKVRIRFLPRE